MFALISPQEEAWSAGSITTPPVLLGKRVAEVAYVQFQVAAPLFWMPCADNVVANQYYYDPNTQQIIKKPE